MAKAAKHFCNHPGCPALVSGAAYCPKHARASAAMRPRSREAGYDRRWDLLSKRFRAAHPFCVACGHPAELTDHIVPIAEGGAVLDEGNLQSLCYRCHATKTHQDERRRAGGE